MTYVFYGTLIALAAFIAGVYLGPSFKGEENKILTALKGEFSLLHNRFAALEAKLNADKTAVVSKVTGKAKQVKSVF